MKHRVLTKPAFAHQLTTAMRATTRIHNRLERCCGNFASNLSRTIALVGFVLLTLCSTKVQAQGFTLITPTAGSQVPAGQPVTVTWTGGPPSANVAVILVDVAANAFAQGFGVVPNSGSQVVTVPVSTGPYGSCGRSFRFYLEDSPQTTWTYGPVFTFVCPTTVSVADGDVSGLIAAINAANANPGPDTINLAPGGTYTLTQVAGPDLYNGPSGLPFIRDKIVINGNGAVIQRSSDPITPDFRIMFCLSCDMVLDGVTVRGGKGADGGGLVIKAVSSNPIDFSKVLIKNSTFTENEASGSGGAIMNYDRLTVVNSTISRNRSFSAYGGGGIMNWAAATTTIVHTTLFENWNSNGRGDAIAQIFNLTGGITLKNSIVASPTNGGSDDCYSPLFTSAHLPIMSLGHNLASDSTCTLAGTGDLNGINPMLGSLANNGGPTQTHLPLSGSPVMNVIPVASCTDVSGVPITTDQRGVARPQTLACDIGSVEAAAGATPIGSGISTQPVDSTTGSTPLSLTFSNVTTAGTTYLTTSPTGTPPPSGFKLGNPPVYYELNTTAKFSGPVTVCLNYTGVSFGNESTVQLYHLESGLWVNTTVSLDTVNNVVCGTVTSFSPFAAVESSYAAAVQSPLSPGTSVFKANRGAIPLKFALSFNGVPTCQLPAAKLAVTRVSGGTPGPVDPSQFATPANTGAEFRIDTAACQYVYSLSASSLGVGTYRTNILIANLPVGSAVFTIE
ncbi:MAG: hypothetical protein HYZ37_17315 [Candidatus Solibacter usitatus]|nr:hypothetical protein [Candidatus Solibacter usitatus]